MVHAPQAKSCHGLVPTRSAYAQSAEAAEAAVEPYPQLCPIFDEKWLELRGGNLGSPGNMVEVWVKQCLIQVLWKWFIPPTLGEVGGWFLIDLPALHSSELADKIRYCQDLPKKASLLWLKTLRKWWWIFFFGFGWFAELPLWWICAKV